MVEYQLNIPVECERSNTPETNLWVAVTTTAIKDAFYGNRYERLSAWDWFFNTNYKGFNSFTNVCTFINASCERIRLLEGCNVAEKKDKGIEAVKVDASLIKRTILQDVKITDVKPCANNPRKNDKSVEFVIESIKEFGYGNPVIVDENMEVIAGHTRLKAIKKLGWKELPEVVKIIGLTEQQKKAYRIADNSSGQKSEWDIELLNIELKDISIDMAKFGLDIPETIEPNEQDDEVPEAPKVAKTVLGDIIELGNHRLMCGDCTVLDNVDKLMNGQKADMVFTDPPYEMITEGGGILKYANSMKQIKDNNVDKFNPLDLFLHSKINIFFHNKPLIKKYIELAEVNDKSYDLAFYKKTNTAPNYKGHLMTDVEYIALIGELDPNKGLEKELYSKCYVGKKDQENKLSYSKPVELCIKYVLLYSKENVLDLFGGSGSTLIACEKTNRKCYMMELDPIYCDVIIQRYCDYVGNNNIKVNGIDTEWKTEV